MVSDDASGPPTPAQAARPSYWEYLRIDELLGLQGGLERDERQLSNHEVLFIVVHQVYELWFKLVRRELGTARDLIARDPMPDQDLSLAVAALRRVREILEVALDHWRVVETLSTRDFLDFRDKLLPASGFQSGQMRAIEILFGLPEEDRIPLGGANAWMQALRASDGADSASHRMVMEARADSPTLREAVDSWLHRTPIRGSSPASPGDGEVVAGFIADFLAAHAKEIGDPATRAARQAESDDARRAVERRYAAEVAHARTFLLADDVAEGPERSRRSRIRAALVFLESYRELPLLAWPRELVDTIVALEQAFILFRHRHARMVEREIGRRVGTGGSPGVAYLDETALRYRVFRDFWTVRTLLVRRGAAPTLEDETYYEFRFGT